MTFEGYSGSGWILFSYDATGRSRSVAAEACRIIFGRIRTDGPKARSTMLDREGPLRPGGTAGLASLRAG